MHDDEYTHTPPALPPPPPPPRLAFVSGQYLGGLFDLTGELNRFAVGRATERDSAGVKECLETILVVSLLDGFTLQVPPLEAFDLGVTCKVHKKSGDVLCG